MCEERETLKIPSGHKLHLIEDFQCDKFQLKRQDTFDTQALASQIFQLNHEPGLYSMDLGGIRLITDSLSACPTQSSKDFNAINSSKRNNKGGKVEVSRRWERRLLWQREKHFSESVHWWM